MALLTLTISAVALALSTGGAIDRQDTRSVLSALQRDDAVWPADPRRGGRAALELPEVPTSIAVEAAEEELGDGRIREAIRVGADVSSQAGDRSTNFRPPGGAGEGTGDAGQARDLAPALDAAGGEDAANDTLRLSSYNNGGAEMCQKAEPPRATLCGAPLAPSGSVILTATRYGDGRLRPDGSREPDYNGQLLGCGRISQGMGGRNLSRDWGGPPDGLYHSLDPTIAAVGPAYYTAWPCGTRLLVCPAGPVAHDSSGSGLQAGMSGLPCLVVVRQDSCPGCGDHLIDLSEAGHEYACGPNAGPCRVRVWAVE